MDNQQIALFKTTIKRGFIIIGLAAVYALIYVPLFST